MDDNLFDKLREMTGIVPEKFSILEQQIDVKLQMEYFKLSKKLKKESKNREPVDLDALNLYEEEWTHEALKEMLVKVASTDNPKAYRIIEEYSKNGRKELKDWAILALQENKMLLESSLLDENQVFISTGLGGKGNMLRYFVVLIGTHTHDFDEFQQKIITSEFDFALKNNQSVLEEIGFFENYATLLVLIPFEVAFQNVFRSALEECNQFGDFLKPNFLVTNVKILSQKEIKDFVEKNELPDADKMDEVEFDGIDDEE